MSTGRYVRDLLGGRRPRRFRADAAQAAELRAAITLAAARPEAGEPRAEFVEDLHRRLSEQAQQSASASAPTPSAARAPVPIRLGPTRRRVLWAGSVAAGAAAIGATADHLISFHAEPEEQTEAAGQVPTLEPNVGTWQTVAETSDLDVGGVRRFDLGSVVGFVSRDAAGLRAVSGICTHQGCRLNLDPGNRELDCPCHNTSFAVDGTLVRHQLYTPPPPLPHLQVREQDGRIDIYVPV
jgi:nitrite reductase/ring-hydroxylating ferredoxin subunit